jgi:hypothetical protein
MDVWEIAGWVIAVALAGVAMYFRLTGKGTEAQYFDQLASMQAAARDAVAAAEQLWVTGQIKRDDRYDWALAHLQKLYPALTSDAFTMSIEAAVFWLKRGVEQWQVRQGTGDGGTPPVSKPEVVPDTDLVVIDVGGVVVPVAKG